MNDLRSWYEEYLSSDNIIDPQGLVSLSFFPTGTSSGNVVSDNWCLDAFDLLPAPEDGQLRPIRSVAISNPSNDQVQYSRYADAAEVWRDNNLSLGYVLPQEFLQAGTPNEVLSLDAQGKLLTSDYIDAYSQRASALASNVVQNGNHDARFWIWNEPNTQVYKEDSTQFLEPGDATNNRRVLAAEVLGALLYTTATSLRSAGVKTITAAALNIVPGTTEPEGDYAYGYLRRMCLYLKSQGVNEYPWDEFSITIETHPGAPVTASYSLRVRNAFRDAQAGLTDSPRPVIVAEWGLTIGDLEELTPPPPDVPTEVQTTYDALRCYYSTMFFYSHHVTAEPPGTFGTTHAVDQAGEFIVRPSTPLHPSPYTSWYGVLSQLYGQGPAECP